MKPSGIAKKLTPPQIETLRSLASVEGMAIYEKYRPAVRLLDLGLAKMTPRRFSSPLWEITDLGKEVAHELNRRTP